LNLFSIAYDYDLQKWFFNIVPDMLHDPLILHSYFHFFPFLSLAVLIYLTCLKVQVSCR
jgi:hypothetical protein